MSEQRDEIRENLVGYVLTCFEEMGASPEDLLAEKNILTKDDSYLCSWASTVKPIKICRKNRQLTIENNSN